MAHSPDHEHFAFLDGDMARCDSEYPSSCLAPIMAPLAYSIGVDPIHLSMIFIMNVNLGNITPPVGIILFATQAVRKVKMELLVRELLPFLIVKTIIILIVTYVPFISVWLPKLFGSSTGGP